MSRARDLLAAAGVVLRRTLLLCVFAVLAVVLYAGTLGFPPWLVEHLKRRISTGTLVFEPAAVRLDLLRVPGLVLEDVRIYCKRVLGPPVVEARRLSVTLDPRSLWRDRATVRRVGIQGGVFRPDMIKGEDPRRPFCIRKPFTVRVRLNDCRVEALDIPSLQAEVSGSGSSIQVRHGKAALQGGDTRATVSGEFAYDSASRLLHAQLVTRGDPRFAGPVLKSRGLSFLERLFDRFQFGSKPPEIALTFDADTGDCPTFRADGSFRMAEASYRGVEFRRGEGGLHVWLCPTGSVVTVDPLLVVRPEGTGRAGFTVRRESSREWVEFEGLSSLDPAATLRMIGVLTNGLPAWLRYRGPFKASAQGRADLAGTADTDYEVAVEVGGIGNRLLFLENCSFELAARGPTNTCRDVRASVCGGTLEGSLEFVLRETAATGTPFRVQGRVQDVDFQRLATDLAKQPAQDYRGRVSGRFDVSGLVEDRTGEALTGEGAIRIKDGRVFMLPLFGGLSQALARVIPGLDFVLRQTDARAEFVIRNREARSTEIQVEGDVLSLTGRGAYRFDGGLDFYAQVQLMKHQTLVAKVLRTLTYPLSKLFEFRLRGTLDEPDWYPLNFSPELFERLGLKAAEEDGGAAPPEPPAADDGGE